jgi:hypothetical protein
MSEVKDTMTIGSGSRRVDVLTVVIGTKISDWCKEVPSEKIADRSEIFTVCSPIGKDEEVV